MHIISFVSLDERDQVYVCGGRFSGGGGRLVLSSVLKLILQKLVMAYQIVVVSVVRGWCAN